MQTNPLTALYTAVRNPLPTAIGSTAAIVPIGGFWIGHYQITSWSPLEDWHSLIVYAALAFSVSTVFGWASVMFGSRAKGLAFTVLLEGLMMFCDSGILSGVALGLIVAINAVECGCRLAVRAAPADVVEAKPVKRRRVKSRELKLVA